MDALCTYDATVVRVIDGDTFELLVDCGMDALHRIRAKLFGVTCEGKGKEPKIRARELVQSARVSVRLHRDSRNRWLVEIALKDGRDLSAVLLEEGHARPFGLPAEDSG